MTRSAYLRILLALTVVTGACSDSHTVSPDAGVPLDGGRIDSAPHDAAPPDSGAPDQEAPPDQRAPDAPLTPWQVPACTSITGFAGIGFGFQQGKVVTASKVAFPGGKSFTTGLVALSRPNTLVAIHEENVYRSEDAGCTWSKVGTLGMKGLVLSAGVGNVAWAWRANTDYLYRIEGSQVTKLSPPVANISGLSAHATKAGVLRVGGYKGALHESIDDGKTWSQLSAGTSTGSVTYVVAFDPNDLGHAIVGSTHLGFSVTRDSGKTWKAATGLSATGGKVNGFNAAVSPANGDVVWAIAIDLSVAGTSLGRQIYRSTDKGQSFTKVVSHQQQADVILYNGMPLYPHPTKEALLYFTFGTCASAYGTNLYRYDAVQKTLTWDNHPYPGFGAVVVSPADPTLLYLAIHGNDDPLCP